MGPDGACALNDLAITNAMVNYFKVKKKHRLELSRSVRSFALEILHIKKERDKDAT